MKTKVTGFLQSRTADKLIEMLIVESNISNGATTPYLGEDEDTSSGPNPAVILERRGSSEHLSSKIVIIAPYTSGCDVNRMMDESLTGAVDIGRKFCVSFPFHTVIECVAKEICCF